MPDWAYHFQYLIPLYFGFAVGYDIFMWAYESTHPENDVEYIEKVYPSIQDNFTTVTVMSHTYTTTHQNFTSIWYNQSNVL